MYLETIKSKKEGEHTMTKNTPDQMQKIVENLLVDLHKYDDCSLWDCSDCPLHLDEPVVDSWGDDTQCGWLLLKTATWKILRE